MLEKKGVVVGKSVKRGRTRSRLPVFKLLLAVLLIGAGLWFYLQSKAPISGRHTFTFTQFVSATNQSECVEVTYNDDKYCIDEWAKVYNVMDKTSQEISRTLSTTVKVTFDADYHSGSKAFVGDKERPTIFLDKVYSASAVAQ